MFKYSLIATGIFTTSLLLAQATAPEPGHSHNGAAFDQGPRSFASVEAGFGNIKYQSDLCSYEADVFIKQGIGQLHGFLNYESERSFRQANYIDPNCVTALWGIAMANTIWVGNTDRALELIKKARSKLTTLHSDRSKMYVESIEALSDKNTGWRDFAYKLKEIYEAYPDDLDAKAFFLMTVWNKGLYADFGMNNTNPEVQISHIFDLAKEILAVQPDHPVHHYIVHMWDSKKYYANALGSADVIGFSAPRIAHMWHMAGHIYTQGQLPFEAWWSQEAAARTDHFYMNKSKIFPFMLHNHAHNNEWLSRTLFEIGNFEKAWKIALNLIAQPKHPTLNNATQYQHFRTGGARIFDAIEYGGFWKKGGELFNTPLLTCPQFKGHEETFTNCERVRELVKVETGQTPNLTSISKLEFRNEVENVYNLKLGLNTQNSMMKLSTLEHLKSSWGLYSKLRYAQVVGAKQLSLDLANQLLAENDKNLMFLLRAAIAYEDAGESLAFERTMEKAQSLSEQLDLNAPEVKLIAAELATAGVSIDSQWKSKFSQWRPIHARRPDLDKMGPLLWQPLNAENFRFIDKNAQEFDFYRTITNKATLLVFVLNDCPHCDAQAKSILDRKSEFDAQGVEIVIVTSQTANYPAYKKYRAFDDFENFPLHGLFIINRQKEIVWEDISSDAFLDIDFVLAESKRLLHPAHRKAMYGEK